jgi:stage II sporulation protein D
MPDALCRMKEHTTGEASMENRTWKKIGMLVWLTLAGGLLAFLRCAPGPKMLPRAEAPLEPSIRVAVVQHEGNVRFSCTSEFWAIGPTGKILFNSGTAGDTWRVRLKYGRPAELVYGVVLYEEHDRERARERIRELKDLGWKSELLTVGDVVHIGERVISDNRQYWVTIGPYATEEQAASNRDLLPAEALRRVIPELSTPPLGALDLIDPSGKVIFSSAEPFSLVQKETTGLFTLEDVTIGHGYVWERQEDRTYRGRLEFRLGNDGKVLCINELPLEQYLKGVLPKEMNPGFPPAALRAQAIAARSYTLARWGIQHRLDPFHLCAEVHCQAYAGVSMEHAVTNEAVESTRGQVLVYQGRICEAYYSAVCGGHTERNQDVWGGTPKGYLQGTFDLPADQIGDPPPSLQNGGEDLQAWIQDRPPAFCNHLSEEAPRALHYTRKYFRWEVTYARRELEDILKDKLGVDIGYLLDIVPLERGISGRCLSVRILGDEDEAVVEGELNIRRALSPTHLYSSCFLVERQMGPDGLPESFTFYGAGWGHGVGMCQAGAAGMALRGYQAEDILNHYYHGTKLRQLYGEILS